jgi:hypothetical protein
VETLKEDSAKVLSSEGNMAVVQLPRRRFPAVAIQGDKLLSLVARAERVHTHAQSTKDPDLKLDAGNLLHALREILEYYNQESKTCSTTGAKGVGPYQDGVGVTSSHFTEVKRERSKALACKLLRTV